MVGAQADTSAVGRGVPAHGTWEEKRGGEGKQEQGPGDGTFLSREAGSTRGRQRAVSGGPFGRGRSSCEDAPICLRFSVITLTPGSGFLP